MWDSDLFGVRNLENGEIGYCCILGKSGEFFGLEVNLGTEGLVGYMKFLSGEVDESDPDIMHLKKSLLTSFVNRSELTKEDCEVIKKLGLSFRGPHSWPQFRSFRPGYFPWHLTKKEAQFLILCLEQSLEVLTLFKKNPNILLPPEEKYIYVRVPKKKGQKIQWRAEWLEPEPLERTFFMAKSIDEERLRKIEDRAFPIQKTWEIDTFYAPVYVREKGKRPYFPAMFLCVDQESRYVLQSHITNPEEKYFKFAEPFLVTLETHGLLPYEILVRREELFILLQSFTERLNIKLRRIDRLKTIEEVRRHMQDFFQKKK